MKLKVNDDGYFETAKYPWISADKAENYPEFEWRHREDEPAEMPEYQGITELEEVDDLEEDCPF